MTGKAKFVGWRERWVGLRDLLGGALLIAVWLALWTVTWAAVAGALPPADAARAEVRAAGTRT
jgi:hypothetical protein